MQRCPKCGYRDGIDWPWVLAIVAFVVLKLSPEHGSYRIVGVGATFLFATAMVWYAIRSLRNYRDTQLRNIKDELSGRPSQ